MRSLSQGQRALWFLHHLAPVGGAYNIAAAARVRTPIDTAALERAFQALVDRHAALRTTFPAVAGEPRQRIAGELNFALDCEDVSGDEERLRSRLAEEAWRPFDLERGPLLRVSLFTGHPGGPVILLVIHHIVADFWSLAILMRELPALYREAAGGAPADLLVPGLAYEEHVWLEQEALAGERGAELLAWWRERLAGLPTLELATARPRPAVQTYRGDTSRLRLPGELASALRARSRAQRGTLFMTLLAAFEALLGRHSGQEDLSVGAPRAGRGASKFADTVGYFVNPVVLRGDLSGDPTFVELLERTRETVLAAFEHGDYPLPLLAEHLQPERDASRTPLFQVSFVLQKETRGVEGLTAFALGEEGVAVGPEDFRLESLSLPHPPSPFDLMLHAVERQGGLSFALQYNADLFDATTADRQLERFAVLLRSVAERPDLALSALPILPEAERHQLLAAWNDTAGAGSEASLFELFAAQAERTPESVAVVYEEEQTTYRELKERATALAHHLASLGVGPESLVGVAAERSTDMVAGLLGVLGAGGAYLPLEPSLPRQRLAMILEDARPAVLLTHRADALPFEVPSGTRLAWLDDASTSRSVLTRPSPDNTAYVIYTSGSTGRPKGVVNSHRGILNRLLWMQEAFGLGAGETFLQKTPFGFDVSIPEFFAPLILGARLVVAHPEGHRDSAYLVRLVQREGVTTIHFVPSMLPFFLDEAGVADCRSLRRVLVSGEAMPWEVEQRCLEVLPVPLVNLYGPTEAAVEVTVWECQPSARPRPVPIGRPIRNTQIHVVGRRLEPMPAGAVGELAIGGVQVARGYFGRPDLTAERFVPDPFSPEGGARLYRTGDLCRHLHGGEIEYLGRLDDQVKIRGFRIEPREIEIVLATHPQVREAAVVVRQSGSERALLACVVLREAEPSPGIAAVLHDFLAARLPPYMVPSFAFGAALDRLPNGKLDRRTLSRWTPAAEPARQLLAPRTPLEELLAGLFAEVLGVERIGVEDSFFEHGGHSLAVMRLIARVRETLDVELPLHRVFETPTVAALVRAIAESTRSEAPPLLPLPRDTPLPLSFAQQRLWFLYQMEPESPVYNMPAVIELRGRLDRAVLAAALGEVARRHEPLRTRLVAGPAGPVQVVDPPAFVLLPLIDLARLPAGRRGEEARRLAREEALRPFDLTRGPLLRTTLVHLGEEERLLLLTMHHVISDGWSLRVLAREMSAVFGAFSQRRPSPLPDLEIQYGDYAVWQRAWLQGDVLKAELAHWRTRLADAPPVLDLPLDRPRPAVMSHRGGSRALALPPALLPSLQTMARQQGVTLFMAALAAFQALLARVGNTEDVSVGTPVAGRGQVRTEGLIGFFVNTLVMRTDLSGEPSFAALLPRVRETALAAYAHQDLPFEKLVEELHPERSLGASPLFQVSFTLDSDPPAALGLGEAEASLWQLEQDTEKFDLSLTVGVGAGRLSGTLGFRTDLFDGVTIQRLAGHFVRLLAGVAENPGQRVSAIPLLSPAEEQQLLAEWTGEAAPYPREATLHALFAEQAALRPDAVAIAGVAGAGESLTYGELKRRAGRWARRLRTLGVGPEVRVALCLDRSPARVVVMLAVLEAGGVYVPLDPGSPRERLAWLLRDSAASVLVTEERSLAVLPEIDIPVLLLDRDEPGEEEAGLPAEAPEVSSLGLAYVMYTSGSTGEPKGVAVTHRGVVRLVCGVDYFRFGPDEVFLQVGSYAFDASNLEIWGALLHGSRLVVPLPGVLAPAELGDLLQSHGVTAQWLSPGMFHQMVEENLAGLAGVRQLQAGGDVMSVPHVRRALAELPRLRLTNGYGPTENATLTTCHAVALEGLEPSVPLGRPIPNTWVYVLDQYLAPVPAGVPGELCTGGDGLARGYLERPAQTAERFVPDPFVRERGGRLYRTGDLVRWRPSGLLEFLGRIDAQVKVRGFRIEPGEIEAALAVHPWVRNAVVLAQREPAGGQRLVAYLAGEGEPPAPAELRSFLQERLPDFMVPAAYAFLPALPLTNHGKVDRKALAALRLERVAGAAGEAPRTPAEELVAGIFAEVLGLERVGAEDDFFALGGHSLLATQVVSRIRVRFRVDLPVRTIFAAPTVEALAGWLESRLRFEGRFLDSAFAPLAGEGPPPLSFAQQRLWFLDQLEPGSPLYNIPVAAELTGRLDRAALEAALAEVVRRHEVLRTTFRVIADEPVQVVGENAGFSLPLIDVHSLEEERRLIAEEARRPFDLSGLRGGPLLRALLLRTEAERHVLLLNLHHIVSDGWSLGIVVRELGALYPAFLEGRPSPLAELAVQYAGFAAWQRRHLSGEHLESELGWWRGQLAGMPQALELPADHPRPSVRSVRGAVHELAIGSELLDGLAALSQRHGTTLFMSLLAGFAILLHRYTGQDDLAVGTPIAGRTRVEMEPLIGLFVNTLVLRADLAGDPDFADLLGRVRETTLSAYAHQEVPFERLIEDLAPERDLSRSPLVQVAFALQNAPLGLLELPGLALTASPVMTGTAKFELTCTLTQTGQGLAGTIEYSRDLFEAPTIARWAEHFVRLLAGAVAEPHLRLSELPLLSAAERQQALVEWNDTGTAFPREACLHEIFAAVAEALPDHPAIVEAEGTWTYRQLDQASNRLARHLRSLGVGPLTPVCLSLERSAELMVGTLAILKAGGVYIPLDASYPRERLDFLLADAGAQIILVHARTRERLAGRGRRLVAVDGGEWGTEDGRPLGERVPAESLAYVIYTSGSTGRPKGVAVPHRAVVRLVRETDYVRLGPGDRVGHAANISFDAATWEIWGPLLNGAAVVVLPRETVLSSVALAAAVREQQVTSLFLTTALFSRMSREVPDAFAGLGELLFGGEAVDPAAVQAVLASKPPRRLLHVYGPTESTTYASWHPVREVPPGAATLPIGLPLANTWLGVLDRRQAPVPSGAPGELYIGGEGLAWGYWNRPELTAERFVPHPWEPGGRLYRTGDLVRTRPAGPIEFLGRIDHQVKIRGFRIEPEEIEAVLRQAPGARDAAVVVLEGGGLEDRRLAAWVAGTDGSPTARELRLFVQERLPPHMVPSFFTVLPALPLTPSSKVDRQALLKLCPEQAAASGRAPRTPTEELLAEIFAAVLGVARVAVDESFFELGGHSLLATQVASRVRTVFAVELPVRAVFEAPTVEGLAGWLDRAMGGEERSRAGIDRTTGEEPPVLSFAQQRLWFLDQLEPGSPLYNIPLAVELTGRLDRAALEAALGEVVRRHQVLRTTFGELAGAPVPRVAEPAGFALTLVDLQGAEDERRLIVEEARRPFDLGGLRGGPLRAVLVRSSAERHVLLLNLHHIVSDGWSLGVLVRELGALYAAFLEGRPSPLPELAIQYADFAAWQRRHLSGQYLESEVAWWRERLAGMPTALDLPTDHPRPAVRSVRGDLHGFTLGEETLAGLHELSKRQGATLFMTLLAGFAALLQRWSGQDDLAVGTPIAGRTREETEPLIGLFVNTLVLRADLGGEPDFVQLLGRVRETTLAAYAHQEVPFERLVEELVPERELSRPPLVQVLFALQNAPLGTLELPGLALTPSAVSTGTAKLDLACTAMETERGLEGSFELSRDLFEVATIQRLAGHFTRLLAGVMEHPGQRVSEIPLLSPAEEQQLLAEWSGKAVPYPREATLHGLFATQAALRPDAVAVAGAGESLTYGELKRRAGRWARRLRTLGVGPEVRVALCLDRSPARIVVMLAVLEAGGVCVPLDPGYPRERLAFLLRDSAASVLVTEERALAVLPETGIPVLLLDRDEPREEEAGLPAEAPQVSPLGLAYVMYTSGSTGEPKGVAVTHRGVVRLVFGVDYFRFGPDEVFLQVGSYAFDASNLELWGALLHGSRLVVPPPGVLSPAELGDLFQAHGVTAQWLSPGMFHQMVEENLAGLAGVRQLQAGGDVMSVPHVRRALAELPGLRLTNGYGPTESSTLTTCHVVDLEGLEPSVPLGRPIANTWVYVLDRHLAPVPAGVPGELYTGGDGLARGYLGRPVQTAERFVPDPFGRETGGRLYRTGDLVRWRPSGLLEFLGRIDAQVKVRGFRIEPGEIEAALAAHPWVRNALVLPEREPEGGQRLAAYLAGEGEPPAPAELRSFLQERLPDFMVPAAYAFLPALPLTNHGKVDRKALAALRPERAAGAAGVAPRTPAEALVARIFAEVLGLERVGVQDDFFALGGHSLLATRVASRIRSRFGMDLPVRVVFSAPTVEGLAGWLARSTEGDEDTRSSIGRTSRDEPLILSFAQQRLWFLDQLEPGSALYNVPSVVELRGRLDRAALAAALGEVMRRHEALRTTFRAEAGGPVQVIHESAGFSLPLVEVEIPAEADRLSAEEARRPFDLGRGPLLRAALLRTGTDRHVLLLTMHHIVGDGWSLGVLIRELGVLYGAFSAGRPSPLPELPIQYADFAAWQRRHLSGAHLDAELAWWRGRLAGMPPAVDLPVDHPRPAVRGTRGAVHSFRIEPEGLAGLTALSRRHGATLFMTLLAGFAALLQRSTGGDDLGVGTPVAGRTRVETEPLIGLFINTLVLRTDLSGEPEFLELLDRVRETALSAYAHQEVPFERLVEELALERDSSRPPLVQVMFALQNAPSGPLELPGLALSGREGSTGTAKLELVCALVETERGLEGTLEYSRDLFEAPTIERLAGHFVRLLAGAAAGPWRRLPELPLLSEGERLQLLVEWNDTAHPFPETTLQAAFERQAELHPDLTAVSAGGVVLTYRELDRTAGRLARRLRALGVGPEVPVALSFERSAAVVVAILGVLKAGGAYLPLDPGQPAERLASVLAAAGQPLLLTGGNLPALISEAGEEGLPADGPVEPAAPENLAYVLHTSGSTGKPKGVCCTHRGVLNLLADFARRQPLTPGSRGSLWTSLSFDVSVYEIFAPLLAGGAVHIVPEAIRQETESFLDWLVEERIDSAYVPPFMVAALLERLERTDGELSLRRLLVGVEPIPEAQLARIAALCPGLAIINGYGPTEATICATLYDIDPRRERSGSSPVTPIGRPAANSGIYLLDQYQHPVPVGVPGDLYIAGAGLARGYLGRPDATAERFVPHPWSATGGERLYRTGDLVRRRGDGNLEFLGRIDHQIKLRGFRIEPGEIEAALLAHPGVREAVVLAVGPAGSAALEGREHRRLVAYVVGVEGGAPSSEELREHLRERLPAYMVPAVYVTLPALPLTPSGKLDRRALPAPRLEGTADEITPPRTPTEELMAGIFAEVLGVERVNVTEDFFALGGHSLLATRVTSRVRTVFGVELPVRVVFETPTVEGIAGWLDRSEGEERSLGPTPRIQKIPREEPLVLSFAQQRLWFLDQLEPGTSVYNVPVAVELTGRLDPGALAAALREVVRRHKALRTTFRAEAGGPVQVVAESADFTLPLVELQGLEEEKRLIAEEARRPFDLSGLRGGPLLRATLLRTGAERYVLLLTMHHIVSDGWSMGVLVREIGALYAAFAEGRPSPLPELAIQYADFAVWQRSHLSGERLESELAWWRGQLAGMPTVLELPADHPRSPARSTRGAVHQLAIGPEVLAGLTALSRRNGTTLFMTLLAGFSVLLQRYAGQDDLAVGTPIAGRTHEETEPLIGLFVNTLVLRADLSGNPSLTALLERVRETTLSAYAHQEVPFERLVEELVPERDLSRTPLVQALLILQNTPSSLLELPGLTLRASDVATDTAKLDLTFALGDSDGCLAGTIEYSRDLFEAPTIERMAGHFTRLLAGSTADPSQRLSELPLLSERESAQLLVEWNDAGTLPPSEVALHKLFEAQAARTPEAVALVAGLTGERWTYRELDLRADSLARRLADLGVGPEVRVGVCLTRTPLLVASLLGILKAGGAYVPLDPEYPSERLAFMLEDTAAAVLLTEPGLVDRLPEHRAELLLVDSDLPAQEGPRVTSGVLPGNLAYLIYTSGSTGRPKGVAIEHRSAVAFARWARTVFPPEDLAGVLAATSVSFDLSVFELFVTLAWGGKVVLAANALELPQLTASGEVVLINTVPSALAELVRQGAVPESVRTINLAGEPLKRSLVQAIYGGSSVSRVLDLYGPSESTTYSTWAPAARDEQREPAIGRPIAGTRVVLLGRHGEPVPAGVPGELLIGGAGLARGYLHRPDLTAERFVPDREGDRLYRTGDLARWLPDGRLEYLGRIDQQVKVRGFRIELGEIEAALGRHPGVREAVVLAREDLAGGPGLAAYVVAAEGEAPEPSALRDVLRQRLPEFMLPAAWAFLPGLPLTPSGKIDRKALAKLRPERPEGEAGEAPRTPTEELVAGLFAEVLGVARVGIGEDFFALGGHSLLATRLASRVRSVFDVELPVRAVFATPTVAGLAAEIAARSTEERVPVGPPLARVERIAALPLSFGQERLWFLQQIEPGSAAYDMPVQVELSGALRLGALSSALTEVVCRHDSLRTTFGMTAGVPEQRISPPVSVFPLPLADLSALPDPAGDGETLRLEREHAETVFDLERGPLFRALLVRLGAERHRLLLNLHHIISDGWSIGVLVRELGALYAALLEGRPSPLPELPIQYPDFAVWQREQLATWQAAELAYWEGHLGGEVAAVELPTDRPRPAIQTFRGGRRQLALSPNLTARLKSLGREQGVTLFMTLLAAAKAVLSRHSGETDLTVGAPVAGRRWAETEGLIGFFLNTLALRTDLSGGPSFRELVARVRATTLEAYSHQDVPFEAVLARLRLDRDLSRSPLFQVLFNMLNLPAQDLSLPGLDLRVLTPAEAPSKFDMTFYLAEAGSQVLVNLVYNADLFDQARMADLLAQLELLLAQAVERPEEPVDGLTLVTGEMLRRLPDPTEPLDAGWIGGVHELFAAQAGRAPDRPAVADGGLVWSYGELLAGCRGLAGWLAVHGVRPGDPVAILAHRSAPLVLAIVGVLTAGAAFTVIDPAYPAWRQAEMLRLAGPRAWVALEAAGPVPEEVRDWLQEAGCPCLELPAGAAALDSLAPFHAAAPPVSVGPQDVACIGFTSGSTGGPKAILGLHGALSHFLPIHCREFEIGPDERFSLLSGLAHDPLQRDIFTPLFLGAAIVVPDPADSGIAGRKAEWMRRERVTVAHLTPSLAQLLTERPPGGEAVPVPGLRRVFLVGEALTRQDVARLRAMAPGVTCINLYGATETQRALAFHRVAPEEAGPDPERLRQVLPLGRGMQDMQLLVVNRAGKLAGLGEIGEILVRSPHLARGYLGNEELTAERFQVNPFTGEAGDRIYRTGDLGRYLPDGEVAFAGRSDFQIKLRGFRIELGEIEATLASHPGVREAVVLLRTDLPGGDALVAYVVPATAAPLETAELHGYLWQRLPAYMVPAAFLLLDSMPLTPNGKLDRRALARQAVQIASAGAAGRALLGPVEEIVAGLWSEVLGLERIGPDDNFFQLGGHSLTGAQVVSRLREAFAFELPLRILFEAPTVATLAAEIERRRRPEGSPELPSIASFREDRSAPPPLSFAQERYWASREQEARSVASTIPVMVLFKGPLDLECLRRALQEVVGRHEVLRTSFQEDADGRPIQVIDPMVPVRFPLVDLEPLSPADRTAEIQRWSVVDGRRHFDFTRAPLFRLTVFRCTEGEHVVLFTVHHSAFDGWSSSVLLRELGLIYNDFRAGNPPPLPPLAAQYQDFARWQRHTLAGEGLDRQVTFWREHLRGAQPIDLCAGPRPARWTYEAGMEAFTIPEELEKRLDTFAAQHGVTLFMILLAAFKALLQEATGREDIVVTCLFANRNHFEIENLIGNFFAGLPLRTRFSRAGTFRDLLARVRDETLAAHEHPDILYEPVMEGQSFLEKGDRGGLATFRIMFQLAKLPPAKQTLSDLDVIRLPFDTGKIRQDLTLFLSQSGRLFGRFKYNRDVLDPERVVRLRDRYLQILAAAVEDPDRPLGELLPEPGK